MKNKSISIFILGSLLFGLSTCKKDEDEIPPVYKLAPTAYEIDDSTSQTIINVDTTLIELNGNTQQLKNLKAGDIILSEISANAPYGFLRRITAIQKTGNDYKFTTEEVSLVEAFEELHIDYTKSFTPADTGGKKEAVEFTVNFPTLPIYDEDGDYFNTTDDQVKLDGSISYSPSLTLKIDISGFHLDYAKAGGSFTTTNTIQVSVGATLASISVEKTIYSQPLTPIQVGPIVIVPFLRVTIGANGSLSVAIVATDEITTTVSAYIKYENEIWKTESNRQGPTNDLVISPILGNVNVRAYVEPGIDFKLFGSNLLNCSAIVQGYLNFQGALSPPGCEVRTGISAGVEAKSKIFSVTLFDLSYPDIVDLSFLIWSCPANNPSCSDGIQNQGETGIDCGGPCPSCSGTCSDGIQNQGETGVDCGGPCPACPPSCSDGIQNQGETAIDCGGPCPACTGTCSDGIQNQGETGIDCGGPCPACTIPTCSDGIQNYGETGIDCGGPCSPCPGGPCNGQASIIWEGYSYPLVEIGSQCWMKENLRVSAGISEETDQNTWANLTTPAWCYYDNNSANEATYGKLYNWHAVNSGNLCPSGWHIPTDAEWQTLVDSLGDYSVVGGLMKSTSTLWNSPNTGATNSSFFTALPGGSRLYTGSSNIVGEGGYFWSSSEVSGTNNARTRVLYFNDSGVYRPGLSKQNGFSCRCVKD